MPTPVEKLLPILQDCYKPRESGWLWVAFYREGDENGIVEEITGEYGDPDLMSAALAEIINGVTPDRAWLALCRPDGCPREADRAFWRRLRDLVEAERLVDMVIFNRQSVWSMREEDSAATGLAVERYYCQMMAKEKVTLTLDADNLAELRAQVGSRSLSATIDSAVAAHVARLRHLAAVDDWLAEMDREYGAIPSETLEWAAQAVDQWKALPSTRRRAV
jgi:hypothetical protein